MPSLMDGDGESGVRQGFPMPYTITITGHLQDWQHVAVQIVKKCHT